MNIKKYIDVLRISVEKLLEEVPYDNLDLNFLPQRKLQRFSTSVAADNTQYKEEGLEI